MISSLLFALVGVVPPLAGAGPLDVDVVDVAPGIIMWTEKRLNGVVSGNIIAVTGERATLVFDAGQHPSVTRQVIADLKRRTNVPVTHLIISHWHDDHWVGTAEFVDAWRAIKVIAHPFTAAMIATREHTVGGAACRKELSPMVTALREQVQSGKRPDGRAIPAVSMTRLANFLEAGEAAVAECERKRPAVIGMTLTDTVTVDLGGRSVKIQHPGRANTAGDLVGWLPQSRVLLTGDLVVSPFPFATMPYVTEWARVLRDLDGRSATLILPGHGPVMRDASYLRDVAAVLESISAQARAAWQPGMPLDSLRKRIDVSSHAERFSRGDPFLRVNFIVQMSSAIARMWQELAREWKPEGN